VPNVNVLVLLFLFVVFLNISFQDDVHALRGLNFELGSWLFEFSLSYVPDVIKSNYINDLYDAIVWYVIYAKPPSKHRSVELLLRFLLYIHKVGAIIQFCLFILNLFV
jgi:hypothetical protein